MTTNNIKIGLFTILIAAVMIPIVGMQDAHADTKEYTVSGPEPEIQSLLDKALDPNTTTQEQQEIKKQLNAMGVPTKEQLDKNPEFWTQKIFEKAQQKLLKNEDKQSEDSSMLSSNLLQNTENLLMCGFCPPNNNMAFWSGFYYDCGKTYMCSYQVSQWDIVPKGTDSDIIFYFTYTTTDVQGWYYAQAPNGSSNAVWEDIYVVLPTGFDQDHSYNQDADPMKFKLLERVNNNDSPHQISFNYHVTNVT